MSDPKNPALTNLNNPFFLTYRNKSDQLSEYLSDHNVRLQSSRTVNLLPARYCRNILQRAMVAPNNERKLRKVLYPNSIAELQESSVDNKIFIPTLSTAQEEDPGLADLADPSDPTATTATSTAGLLGINSESKFTMKPTRPDLNNDPSEPNPSNQIQESLFLDPNRDHLYCKDIKKQLQQDKAIFIRNNNCIHFVSGQQPQPAPARSLPDSNIGDSQVDSLGPSGPPPSMPLVNSTSITFCSTALSSHSRRHLVTFEEE